MNRFLFLAWIILIPSGCATLFTGTHDDITVMSTPPGATVIIDELDYGQTPVIFPMKRDAMRQNGKRVTVHKEGYEDKNFNLQKDFNIASVCNLGNILFWGVDFISGALFVYDPTTYSVKLVPIAATNPLQPFVPKEGDAIDLVIVNWGPANQTTEVDGERRLLYNRLDATYLFTVSKDQRVKTIQIIPK